MNDALARLLVLQDVDIETDQARHRRQALPERAELAELDRLETRSTAELAAAEASVAEISERQSRAETELASTEERIAQIDKRLYGGGVSASRDLQAMTEEIDHLRSRASALEDDVLGLLEAREPFESSAATLRTTIDDIKSRRADATARLRAGEAAVDAELVALGERRESASAGVPADLVSTYERLRGRLGGIGVARLVANHCDGCHLTLSAMELDRVRHLPDGEIYTCEQCGRILVP